MPKDVLVSFGHVGNKTHEYRAQISESSHKEAGKECRRTLTLKFFRHATVSIAGRVMLHLKMEAERTFSKSQDLLLSPWFLGFTCRRTLPASTRLVLSWPLSTCMAGCLRDDGASGMDGNKT